MRVNTTGHNKLASNVKHLVKVSVCMQFIGGVVHTLNLITFDDDVGLELAVGVYNGTVLNEV